MALAATEPASPLYAVVERARQLQLADEPAWRALVHYKPALGGRFKSQMDSAWSFLSQRGKTSPDDELTATLAALFSNAAKPPLRLTPGCRFVARRAWLESQLGELSTLLPEQNCPEFDQYRRYLNAHTLTLVFPAAHPNNPSSAFGHTLIRIDQRGQSPDARLLNMSLNFAAEVPAGVSDASYAWNGLVGGFEGKFRLLPYHMKLREYAQIANRDTWEYELDLDQAQVDRVLAHAYEMLVSYYDYYFLSENCSYHLLTLLDVAFADQPLSEPFNLWTIPTDTIRVLRERGLISRQRFVPSTVRTLRARREALSSNEQQLALRAYEDGLDSVGGALSALAPERQAAVLDLLGDYRRDTRLQDDPSATGISAAEREVLSARSRLAIRTRPPKVPAPDMSPDLGHGTSRIGLRHSAVRDGARLTELTFRPAYHDYRDPSQGYGDRAAIDFGLLGVAYDHEQHQSFVRRFTILSVESIEPRDEYFKPVSWHTRLLWERDRADTPHRFTFNVGAGGAWSPGAAGTSRAGSRRSLAFGLLESDIVEDRAFDKRVSLRLGASVGVHWQPSRHWRLGAELQYREHVGERFWWGDANLWTSLAWHTRHALVLEAQVRENTLSGVEHQLSAELRTYF